MDIWAFVSIMVVLATPKTSLSAEDSGAEPLPWRVDIDLTAISIGISGAAHVGRNLYTGGGFSVLPPFNLNTLKSFPLEWVTVQAFIRYEPFRALQFEAGPRLSYFEEFKPCLWGSCGTPDTGYLIGPYLGMAILSSGLMLGTRIEYAFRSDSGEGGVFFYPLFLRIEFRGHRSD
jgi:hypothetical protein